MSNSILYVNACVRKESRTERLAKKLLAKPGKPYEEICLQDTAFRAVDEEYLIKTHKSKLVSLITALTAALMSAVSMTYILMADEGFHLAGGIAYPVGIAFAAVSSSVKTILFNMASVRF